MAMFTDVGLSAAKVGTVDASGIITLAAGGRSVRVLDVRADPATGLSRIQL